MVCELMAVRRPGVYAVFPCTATHGHDPSGRRGALSHVSVQGRSAISSREKKTRILVLRCRRPKRAQGDVGMAHKNSMVQNRRRFLATLSFAGASALFGPTSS